MIDPLPSQIAELSQLLPGEDASLYAPSFQLANICKYQRILSIHPDVSFTNKLLMEEQKNILSINISPGAR